MFIRKFLTNPFKYFTNETTVGLTGTNEVVPEKTGRQTKSSKQLAYHLAEIERITSELKKLSIELAEHSGKVQELQKAQRKPIPSKVRKQVWFNQFQDKKSGPCFVCRKTVKDDPFGWHCSHIVAQCKGGPDIPENLRVCCAKCNQTMKDKNMFDYMIENNYIWDDCIELQEYMKSEL